MQHIPESPRAACTRASPGRPLFGFSTLVVLLIGCPSTPQGGPRVETVPVTGKVLVDQKPLKGVVILFRRVSDPTVKFSVPEASAETDENGHITRVSTYVSADGCPPGDYVLQFRRHHHIDPLTGQPVGDIFGGKYSTMDSDFKVTIPEQSPAPVDVGTIELSTK